MKKLGLSILTTMLLVGIGEYSYASHPAFDVDKALKALETGHLEEAESILQKSRFVEPDSYVINYNLGIVTYRKRDYERAAKYFARASELAGTSDERFNALYDMGNAAFKANDFLLAIASYKNALAVKQDFQADYNLKVAEQKLKELLEKMKQQQEQQQQPQQNQNEKNQQKPDGNQQQKNDQNGSNGNQQQDNQQNSEQQGQNEGDQKNQSGENSSDSQQGNSGERQNERHEYNENQDGDGNSDNSKSDVNDSEQQSGSSQKGEDDSQKTDEEMSEQKGSGSDSSQQAEDEKKEQDGESSDSAQQSDEEKESDSESKSGNANEQDKEGEDKNSDKESILNEETAAPEEDRRDVKMTKDTGKVSRPEASQKARALKNMRLDKEDIEKYLKQMEKQESELQQRFRINNIEEKDPAYMDPEELREWLKVRNKKKEQQQLNKQDW